MLLIKSGETPVDISAEQAQKIVEKYIAFARKLRSENRYLAGDELASTGRLMQSNNGKIVDGPFAETKESIGGYFLISADSYDHAVEIARDCPVFDRGGALEIREIVEHG
jgi:hypothetical protein